MTARKRVLIVHTGGTLGMNLNGSPEDAASFESLLRKHAPRIFEIADVGLEILLNKDSSNMRPADWITIARYLHDQADGWDGFVVTHGTDTLAFTSSALSFLLQGFPKPIVLTGSQRPIADPNSDAPRNLVNSVEIAAVGRVREVSVFFDCVLLRGNRVKKMSIPSFGAFDSPNFAPLARTGMRMEYGAVEPPPARPYRFDQRLETNVLSLSLFPGVNAEFFLPLIDRGLKGVVLQAFGPGDIPLGEFSVVHLIRRLTERGIPTVICSQAVFGTVDLALYETGRAARDAGAISALDMTWECALVKTMVLLGQGLALAPFREQFARDLAGELTEPLSVLA